MRNKSTVNTLDTAPSLYKEVLRSEWERLNKLSVKQIMLDVVPGSDGEGLEIYAESVDDVVRHFDKLIDQVEQQAREIERFEAQAGSGTRSNKYRAELYDEVWESARSMGFSNVTEALRELAALRAQQPPASCTCVYATSKNTPSVRNGFEVGGYLKEKCAACAQQPGVVLPERMTLGAARRNGRAFEDRQSFCAGANYMRDEVARLNSSPVSAELIRFDFTNAQGQPDSKMVTHDEMRQRYSDLLISNAAALGGGSGVSAGGVDERAAWTDRKPTEEGAYWIRGNGLEADALVQVKHEEGELWCNLHMRNSEPVFEYGYTIEQLSSEFEWLGPLQARAALTTSAQSVPSVQITGHLDEVDAPVWEFIHAEARKLGPLTGSIDSYNFLRPNGAQPNGVVVVLWSGQKIHAVALAVRDAMNRTQCVRLLAEGLATAGAQSVPDGWKLVPVEATTEMVEALKARIACTSRGGILNAGNALNDAIAAAPAPGKGGDSV